jgi:hypothetical protein
MKYFWRGGHGRINGWLRVLELAAGSHEAAPGKGACYSSTNMLTSSCPKEGQHDTKNVRSVATAGAARFGGGVILIIGRRRKARYGGFEYFPHSRALLDPVITTMHNATATHISKAHLILESASPG